MGLSSEAEVCYAQTRDVCRLVNQRRRYLIQVQANRRCMNVLTMFIVQLQSSAPSVCMTLAGYFNPILWSSLACQVGVLWTTHLHPRMYPGHSQKKEVRYLRQG